MELRPELMPPALDGAKVLKLAEIASELDGYNSPDVEELLRTFNREAGTGLSLEDFQKIYCSERHEDWVRRILYQQALSPDAGLSRAEMAEVVTRVMGGADEDFYLELFLANCNHPSASNLIFWPNLVPDLPQDREPTAEEIADLAMRG